MSSEKLSVKAMTEEEYQKEFKHLLQIVYDMYDDEVLKLIDENTNLVGLIEDGDMHLSNTLYQLYFIHSFTPTSHNGTTMKQNIRSCLKYTAIYKRLANIIRFVCIYRDVDLNSDDNDKRNDRETDIYRELLVKRKTGP